MGFSIILVVGTSLVRREFFTQLLRTAPGALRTKLRNTLHHRLPYRTGTVFILACYSIPFAVVLSLVIDLEYFFTKKTLSGVQTDQYEALENWKTMSGPGNSTFNPEDYGAAR